MRWTVIAAAALAATTLAPAAGAVAEHTQTIQLRPGWNAVFLEVRPEPNDSESVFGGLPLASAWTWNPRVGKIEFVDDPSEELIESPAWLGYFPRPRPESVLTNLFAVQANRAYLIKIEGDQPVTWTITGKPEVKNFNWVPDSFNLLGFFVDPNQPPTFAQYLSPSPAHVNQPIYRLSAAGVWELVNPFATTIQSGEAYWVYSKGPSDYSGPIDLRLESGKTMDFGGGGLELRMRIRNLGSLPAGVSLTQVPGPTPIRLSYFNFDPDTGQISWPQLPPAISLPAPEEGEVLVDLAPRRAEFGAPEVGSVLVVRDGFGYRRMVSVLAHTAFAPPPFLLRRQAAGRTLASAVAVTNPLAGLWVGSVQVREVSESQTGSLVPTPVGREFAFRVLMHVDGGGTVRLLKEVIQLWKEGTRVPDPENPGLFLVDEPGFYVLVTDDSLIPLFEGAVLRDGQPVGFRISTVGYDFQPQFVVMNGSFSIGGGVETTLTLESEAPTNPFRHGFHPDHNNLDETYTQFLEEAFVVTRQMEFDFAPEDPLGRSQPEYGESTIGGVYRERISGLHRNDIAVEGVFVLRRASVRPLLNQ
jgi:hypothetical protein